MAIITRTISGSLTHVITGSLNATAFTGSLRGTATFATSASRAITATTATSANSANQLGSVNRSVTRFQTTDATPYNPAYMINYPVARYTKLIVIGNSNSGSLGGEFTKIYGLDEFGSSTTLSSTGTLADNFAGTPTFTSTAASWTATGINGVTINWQVILEYSDVSLNDF